MVRYESSAAAAWKDGYCDLLRRIYQIASNKSAVADDRLATSHFNGWAGLETQTVHKLQQSAAVD
jgi:hypothetical protein